MRFGGFTEQSRVKAMMRSFKVLIKELKKHIGTEPNYNKLRWHDVVVLLLIQSVTKYDSDLNKFASQHLSDIERKSPEMKKYYAYFRQKNWT